MVLAFFTLIGSTLFWLCSAIKLNTVIIVIYVKKCKNQVFCDNVTVRFKNGGEICRLSDEGINTLTGYNGSKKILYTESGAS